MALALIGQPGHPGPTPEEARTNRLQTEQFPEKMKRPTSGRELLRVMGAQLLRVIFNQPAPSPARRRKR